MKHSEVIDKIIKIDVYFSFISLLVINFASYYLSNPKNYSTTEKYLSVASEMDFDFFVHSIPLMLLLIVAFMIDRKARTIKNLELEVNFLSSYLNICAFIVALVMLISLVYGYIFGEPNLNRIANTIHATYAILVAMFVLTGTLRTIIQLKSYTGNVVYAGILVLLYLLFIFTEIFSPNMSLLIFTSTIYFLPKILSHVINDEKVFAKTDIGVV